MRQTALLSFLYGRFFFYESDDFNVLITKNNKQRVGKMELLW